MDAADSGTPGGVGLPPGQPPAVPPWPRSAVGLPPGQPGAVPSWPRSVQLTTVFLLGVATALLGVHSCRGIRWGSRPTELERSALVVHQIDLNHADRAQLLQVPGVGDSLAQRIEQYR